MPMLDVGAGGGIGGIPTRYVIIGAGVLGVGAILLLQRNKAAGAAPDSGGNVASYGTALGPNAAVALGSLETTSRQQFGDLQQQLHDLFGAQAASLQTGLGDITTQIGGVSTQIGSGMAGLSDYEHGLQQSVLGLYMQQLAASGASPDQIAQWLRDKFPSYGLGTLPPGYFGANDPVQPGA